jgi:hypothetical protein
MHGLADASGSSRGAKQKEIRATPSKSGKIEEEKRGNESISDMQSSSSILTDLR